MRVWRLAKANYASLDGEGARLYGSRWNSVGKPVVYTSCSLSLALLEQLVRIEPDEIPADFVSLTIEIPDAILLASIKLDDFPINWAHSTAQGWFRQQGDKWLIEQQTLLLKVPSVIVPEENNLLINPLHPDFKLVTVIETKPFVFDKRFFQ